MNKHKIYQYYVFCFCPPAERNTWLLSWSTGGCSEAMNTSWSCRDSRSWGKTRAAKAVTEAEFYSRTCKSTSTETVCPVCRSPASVATKTHVKTQDIIRCMDKEKKLKKKKMNCGSSQLIQATQPNIPHLHCIRSIHPEMTLSFPYPYNRWSFPLFPSWNNAKQFPPFATAVIKFLIPRSTWLRFTVAGKSNDTFGNFLLPVQFPDCH